MSKAVSGIGKVLKKAAPYIAAAAGTFYGGPQGGLAAYQATSAATASKPKRQNSPSDVIKAATAPTFTPTRPDALSAPSSLSDIGAYGQDQQRSALATKGINQGLGDDENAYYKNLVQRSLIGDGNQVTGSIDSLLPVEQQYFQKQGSNMSDINAFLQSISS